MNQLMCTIFVICCICLSAVFAITLSPEKKDFALWTGDELLYTCNGNDETEYGHLQWKDPKGSVIRDNYNGRQTIFTNANPQTKTVMLFIIGAEKRNAGKYSCEHVINGGVVSSTHFNLNVIKKVTISKDNTVFTGAEGNNISIPCTVLLDSRSTNSEIYWKRDDIDILKLRDKYNESMKRFETSYEINLTKTLTIYNLSREDEGKYQCHVLSVNPYLSGFATVNMDVKVQFAPRFDFENPKYVWIPYNSEDNEENQMSINITCVANADPFADFKWHTSNGEDVTKALRNNVRVYSEGNTTVLNLFYNDVNEIKSENSEQYLSRFKCHASNKWGHSSRTFELKAGQTPISPSIVTFIYANGLLTLVLNESKVEPPVDKYRIEIDGREIFFNASNNENLVNNTYQIAVDVSQGKHRMAIFAYNSIGWSEDTPQSYFLAVTSKASELKTHFVMLCYVAILFIIK